MMIQLQHHIGTHIAHRSAIRSVLEKFIASHLDVDELTVDFTGVEFMSRAAAHEWLMFTEQYPKVRARNLAPAIQRIMDTVEARQGHRHPKEVHISDSAPRDAMEQVYSVY